MGKKMPIRLAKIELGLSDHALRRAIKTGQIPFIMIGNRYVLDVEQVERVLEQTALANMRSMNNTNSGIYGELRKVL